MCRSWGSGVDTLHSVFFFVVRLHDDGMRAGLFCRQCRIGVVNSNCTYAYLSFGMFTMFPVCYLGYLRLCFYVLPDSKSAIVVPFLDAVPILGMSNYHTANLYSAIGFITKCLHTILLQCHQEAGWRLVTPAVDGGGNNKYRYHGASFDPSSIPTTTTTTTTSTPLL